MSEVNLKYVEPKMTQELVLGLQNYDKFSIDISVKQKFASELPYGNDSLDIFG